MCEAGGNDVGGDSCFVDLLGLEVPVTLVAVLVVELVAARISGGDALATHDVAGTGALVEVAVGLFRVERQAARLGACYLRWLEHLGLVSAFFVPDTKVVLGVFDRICLCECVS